jgi:predicted nucleic acid-binding protein
MKRVLQDTNVLLDVLLEREPHVHASSTIWAAVERGLARGFVSAHAITTIHYLIRKERDEMLARRAVAEILQVFDVVEVDRDVLLRALQLSASDFEDAVTAAAAKTQRAMPLLPGTRLDFASHRYPHSPRSRFRLAGEIAEAATGPSTYASTTLPPWC